MDPKTICARILSDTINHLAVRFGSDAVAMALTEIMGCETCSSDAPQDLPRLPSTLKVPEPHGGA